MGHCADYLIGNPTKIKAVCALLCQNAKGMRVFLIDQQVTGLQRNATREEIVRRA